MSTDHFDYRSWIMAQKPSCGEVEKVDDNHFQIVTAYALAQINFYQIENEPEVIEFRIERTKDGEVVFFLHFHADPEEHAKALFEQMIEVLQETGKHHATRILLCCTAGLTTSYFAMALNEAAKALKLDWSFDAVSVSEVYTQGLHFDCVLVAPQIGFQQKKIASVLKDIPVLTIPAVIFGAYDAGACISFVQNGMKEFHETLEEKARQHILHHDENSHVILSIAVLPDVRRTIIRYRLYDHGAVAKTGEVIKPVFYLEDLYDVIETNLCSCRGPVPEMISIALPGIIHEGKMDLPPTRTIDLTKYGNHFAIEQFFRDRYHQPVYFYNNVNAAALGWYSAQNEYENIVFHSQPYGWRMGGEGIIVNGHLVTGAHSAAGEVKYIVPLFSGLSDIPHWVETPDQMVPIVARDIVGAVTYLDPEVVCVRSDMTPYMDEIEKELEKFLPADHIPHLIKIDNMDEYVLLGTMLLCLLEKQA
ncbi:MAG: ROK family protein [Lactimicrobium sp.]|uniref:ROK family protein n=1 Tax=Lactimicrobium sp. TaxID=2563780 RepID=UPI002F3579E9